MLTVRDIIEHLQNTSYGFPAIAGMETSAAYLKAEPFLKWAGGKGQLLRQYEAFFPKEFNNFLEPFVGGGAVFFHLFNSGRLQGKKKVYLLDSNEELINCYLIIKEDVEGLIKILNGSIFINTEEIFYKIRAENPKDKFERAARTIYLNKTCFNGLYRVNNQGKFNVPFGGYKNPLICNARNLIAVSFALQNVEILCGDFDKCLELAEKEDFIYFDPPYQPLNKTSSFTSYTKEPFAEKEQVKLNKVFKKLDKMGCKIMLSNSDTSLIRKLYKNFRIEVVFAKRAINCKAWRRGAIRELVILNY
ncbi:MAG: DNA adenine methylase [Candidatus Omnitrophota bacterium]